MNAVLGLSVTPSTVGLVLVQGQDADGATMETTGFEVDGNGSSGALQTSEQAAAAVLRTEAIAAGQGHRLQSIGVTWSDEADAEASLLLKSLSDSGFENIVPVRLWEAADALARGIAEVAGYRTTAVCVIEPEQLIALVVRADEGAVQTAVNHTVVTEEDLIGWLSAVFTKADWLPEALVLVGSAEDLDGLMPVLEEALSVPVFSPAEAQLALARGAALACAQREEFRFDGALRDGIVRDGVFQDGAADSDPDTGQRATVRRAIGRLAPVGPVAMLAAGVVTFVASASAALALQAAPERPVLKASAGADMSAQTPAAARGPAPLPQRPAPALEVASLPAPDVAPVPAPAAEPAPLAEPIAEASAMARTLLPQPAVAATVPPLDAPAPLDAPLSPVDITPPAALAPEVAPPPDVQETAGMMQRIRERLAAIGDDQQPPLEVLPPPGAPPLPRP